MRKTLRFLLVAKFERTFASLPCISATQVVDLRPVIKVQADSGERFRLRIR
jgi:hypothetical protein